MPLLFTVTLKVDSQLVGEEPKTVAESVPPHQGRVEEEVVVVGLPCPKSPQSPPVSESRTGTLGYRETFLESVGIGNLSLREVTALRSEGQGVLVREVEGGSLGMWRDDSVERHGVSEDGRSVEVRR